MATQIIHRLISDLSGTDADSTIRFSFDGQDYSIDLTEKEETELRKVLNRYMEHGVALARRRASGHRIHASGASPNAVPQAARKQYLSEVRAWAREKGMQIAEFGRVPTNVLDMYDNRHALQAAAIAEAAERVNASHRKDTLDAVNGLVPVKANGETVQIPIGKTVTPKKTPAKASPPPALFSNEESPAAPVRSRKPAATTAAKNAPAAGRTRRPARSR